MSEPYLVGEAMTGGYGNGPDILHDCTVSVEPGEIAVIVGPNGAGKSTAMKAIFGMLSLGKGEVKLNGEDISKLSPQDRVLKGMGFVPQNQNIFTSMTVQENLEMGAFIRKDDFSVTMDQVFNLFPILLEKRDQSAGELSGGQRKRVFLARALAQKSEVILLDEPFTGVDVKTETAIIKLLREMRKEGKIMLVSTHNLGSVPEFCDRTILIKETVLAYGKTKKTFTRQNLELAFGGVLRHFVLSGTDLHDDDDTREIRVISDDERPFVLYDDENQSDKDA